MTGCVSVAAAVLLLSAASMRSESSVHTVFGTGTAGHSDRETTTPFGFAVGPDGALYFCEMDGQRVRRLDRATKRVTTIAGTGERGYSGDGGPALAAALNMPHELQFDAAGDLYIADRDSHTIRRIDMKTGIITTAAGTGVAGFSGDGGRARAAQLRGPHCLIADGDTLLICDVGNHRIRRLHLRTGLLDTYAGTGEAKPTPEGAPAAGTPLNGPRALARAPNGDLYLALREGNAVYRIDGRSQTLHRVAGTGEQGFTGDGGPALEATVSGPKGLAYAPEGALYIADTENHAIRRVDLTSGKITTVLGTGQPGDGPEPDSRRCRLSRPHGLLVTPDGLLVADSGAHRIRLLR
jgi:DNA-binding beta-propeller fold protein YncE